MTRDETRKQVVEMELKARLPTTQEQACEIGARISLQMGSRPQTEGEITAASEGGARGLFGEAFEAASEEQQARWVAMYERALRSEMKKHAQ